MAKDTTYFQLNCFFFEEKVLSNPKRRQLFIQALIVGYPFILVGLSSGYLSGLSRVAVIGQIMPAILGLIGGGAAVFYSNTARTILLVAIAISSLSLALVVGASYGSRLRGIEEARQAELEPFRKVKREMQLRIYKKNLQTNLSHPTSNQLGGVAAQPTD